MAGKCVICGDVVSPYEFVTGNEHIGMGYVMHQADIDRLCGEHAKAVLKYLWEHLYGEEA